MQEIFDEAMDEWCKVCVAQSRNRRYFHLPYNSFVPSTLRNHLMRVFRRDIRDRDALARVPWMLEWGEYKVYGNALYILVCVLNRRFDVMHEEALRDEIRSKD